MSLQSMSMQPTKLHSVRSGFGLIEVLVVLVLLLIGIFSVVRLFPGGFLVNRQSEEATYAMRLARQQLDYYTQISSNVMDAIVPVVPVAAEQICIGCPAPISWLARLTRIIAGIV